MNQAAGGGKKGAAKASFLLWMKGGRSHIDTFDPKPGTKTGGDFKAIDTRIKGVKFSEHLPLVAEQGAKPAIIPSLTAQGEKHDRAGCLIFTRVDLPTTPQHPSLGAWVRPELGGGASELRHFGS